MARREAMLVRYGEKEMAFTVKLPDFASVVANGTAIIDKLPLGMTYEGIMLQLGGTALTKAMLTRIVIKLNQKTIWDITGSDLDALNAYRGYTANAAYLPIFFADPRSRTINGQNIGAIDTSPQAGITNMQILVTIAGATAPTLAAWALVSNPQVTAEKGLVSAMLNGSFAPSGANTFSVPVPIGSDSGALIRRVAVFHAQLTQMDVKRNGVYIHEEGTPAVVNFVGTQFRRVTQAGLYVYDPCFDDNQSNAVPTRNANMEFRMKTAAADNFRIYAELYAPLASI